MNGRWWRLILGAACCHVAVVASFFPLLWGNGRCAYLLAQGLAVGLGLVLVHLSQSLRGLDSRALVWLVHLVAALLLGALLGAVVGACAWLPEYLIPSLRSLKGPPFPYQWVLPAQAAGYGAVHAALFALVALVLRLPRMTSLPVGADVAARVALSGAFGLGAAGTTDIVDRIIDSSLGVYVFVWLRDQGLW